MYALLEMVSALGIEKVDEQYIEDTLKSIKWLKYGAMGKTIAPLKLISTLFYFYS
jgi:hypothetical protein